MTTTSQLVTDLEIFKRKLLDKLQKLNENDCWRFEQSILAMTRLLDEDFK